MATSSLFSGEQQKLITSGLPTMIGPENCDSQVGETILDHDDDKFPTSKNMFLKTQLISSHSYTIKRADIELEAIKKEIPNNVDLIEVIDGRQMNLSSR